VIGIAILALLAPEKPWRASALDIVIGIFKIWLISIGVQSIVTNGADGDKLK